MDIGLGTLIIVVAALVALPLGSADACCDDRGASQTPQSQQQNPSSSDQNVHACCGSEQGSSCADQSPCCPDEQDDDGCHCPGCGSHAGGGHMGGLSNQPLPLPTVFSAETCLKKQAFYFAEHLPEEVFLPIWQPPQLAA